MHYHRLTVGHSLRHKEPCALGYGLMETLVAVRSVADDHPLMKLPLSTVLRDMLSCGAVRCRCQLDRYTTLNQSLVESQVLSLRGRRSDIKVSRRSLRVSHERD